MWSNPRPPGTAPGDQYNNNNSAGANPYSRNASITKTKPGRQSTDPWDWGWDENNTNQNDDWNNGWNQPPAPVPNVIPNPQPSVYHQNKPDTKPHGTPDLIPEKHSSRPVSRGGGMQMSKPYQKSNAADFFENVDLNQSQHFPINPTPSMYNVSDLGQNSMQPTHNSAQLSQNTLNKSVSPASYFNQTNPAHNFGQNQPYYHQGPSQFLTNHQNSPMSLSQQPPSQSPNFVTSAPVYQQPLNSSIPNSQQQPVSSTPNSQQPPLPNLSYSHSLPPSTPNYQQSSPLATSNYQQPSPSSTPSYQQTPPLSNPNYQQLPSSSTPNNQQQPFPSMPNYQKPVPSSTLDYQQPHVLSASNYQPPPPSSTPNLQQPPPSTTPNFQQPPSSTPNYQQTTPPLMSNYQQPTLSSTSQYQLPPSSTPNHQKPPPSIPNFQPVSTSVASISQEQTQSSYQQGSNSTNFNTQPISSDLNYHQTHPSLAPDYHHEDTSFISNSYQSSHHLALSNHQRPHSPSQTFQQSFIPTSNQTGSSPVQLLSSQQTQSSLPHPQLFSQDTKNQSSDSFLNHGQYMSSGEENTSQNSSNYVSQSTGLRPTTEVENVEIAPPEGGDKSSEHFRPINSGQLHAGNYCDINQGLYSTSNETEETNIPDNQETVPDNEEQLQALPSKLNQLKINSTIHNPEQWNTSAGWENQEIAPRCELDRNQYLETGQLDSNDVEEIPLEVDNNDEGEALPPPGLHRMVTGQGTESISQRSVLGQPPSISHSNGSGFVRLVPGQQTPRDSPEPTGLERLVPGQQTNEEQRLVPGHHSQDDRFSSHQMPQDELQRLIPGQVESEPPIGTRMILGQQSDDENNVGSTDMERMIPGEVSEHESSFPEDVPDDERMVPGGMSDDSRSQSISIDDETRNSSDRMILGMMEGNQLLSDSQTERLVTVGSSTVVNDSPPPPSNNAHDGARVSGMRTGTPENTNHPPPGLHRLVLGQINSANGTNIDQSSGKQAERSEEKQGGNHPPAMQRMVVGQFREKEAEHENDKEKEIAKTNDREDDSDSDDRSYRRRHRHRRDSYDDERKERDYSSEREYRGKREERREYRKKRDDSYNRSPEYRSDHEEFDRNEYRERKDRERDRRDRPRDRRRRSPDYNYDPYYRDDPRKLHPRDRDRRYYEPYEDDYYYRENRSRPSSRSGSEYRRHRDYPPRHPYYQEPGGMGNYMHYYQMQQYYENMRRTDPQAYALWYEQYMAQKFGSASNDRASVHSGRSSANDNSQIQEHDEDQDAIKAEDAVSHRSTPPLYTSAHIRGEFNSLGQLIVVNPHDPFSYGEHQATVTLCKVNGPNAADSPDLLEFIQNPGPFISGVTHKNTVLQYLKKQSDQISHSSGKLLYDLIRLVIKLNGVVDMTDVADLLMESYRSCYSEEEDFPEPTPTLDGSPPLSPQKVTSKFRQLLLEGNKNEALEWAMKNKDWGHALFLASKMDSRTHNNVMLRFANGLQSNDPLQTLYQLMSGREPQAATCAADKKWGDWRPHLAMMLSNRTANIELDRKAILTLGDSLGGRGRLYAAHFCYLTAQLEFSHYSDRHAKLVLLGASSDLPFPQFATCRAIMLTLCYEYAKQLSNKEWCIYSLRPYRWMLACRLYDHGNIDGALAYLEALAHDLMRLPHRDDRPIAELIIDMADKLKVADDTSLAYSTDPTSDLDWLARLKMHVQETNDPNYLSPMTHGISTSTVSDLDANNGCENPPQPAIQDMPQSYPPDVNNYSNEPMSGLYQQDNYYDPTQNHYYNPAQSIPTQDIQQPVQGYMTEQQTTIDSSTVDHWAPNMTSSWDQQQPQLINSGIQEDQQVYAPPVEHQQQPQISVKPSFGYMANTEEDSKPQVDQKPKPVEKPQNREKSNRRANKTQQSGSGWFGGIWDKLALRPKNQMILPDDKNPPIVWDEKTKRWVNTDSTEEEQSAQLKPPPKASELIDSGPPSLAPPAPGPAPVAGLPPPATTSTNKYKLQRGKGMRGNYVDVMASSKTTSAPTSTQPLVPMPQAPVTNFFVPAPVPGNENAPLDFLSPSGPVSYEPSKSEDQPPQVGYGKGNAAFYNPSNYQS